MKIQQKLKYLSAAIAYGLLLASSPAQANNTLVNHDIGCTTANYTNWFCGAVVSTDGATPTAAGQIAGAFNLPILPTKDGTNAIVPITSFDIFFNGTVNIPSMGIVPITAEFTPGNSSADLSWSTSLQEWQGHILTNAGIGLIPSGTNGVLYFSDQPQPSLALDPQLTIQGFSLSSPGIFSQTYAPVPLPASMVFLATGLLGFAAMRGKAGQG